MKINYLGTAAAEGWPAMFCTCRSCERARKVKGKNYRTRAQALIDDRLLVDFGPDTYHHMLKYDLRLSEIQQVLVTHSHMDHFYPTELIFRGRPYAHGRSANKLTVYGNEKCRWRFLHALFTEDDSADFRDCVGFSEIRAFEPFEIPGYRILPLKARHDPSEECLIFLIRDREGKCLLYGNDTGYFPEETWKALEGVQIDCASLDCTLISDPTMESSHMGLRAVRRTVKRLKSMGCIGSDSTVILTHFSHNGKLLHEELEREVARDGFVIAYDGMVWETGD